MAYNLNAISFSKKLLLPWVSHCHKLSILDTLPHILHHCHYGESYIQAYYDLKTYI
jgi:hypothetical protein